MKPALSLVDPDDLLTRAATVLGNPILVHRSPARPNESWKWEATDQREIERAVTLARESLARWRAIRTAERFNLLRKFARPKDSICSVNSLKRSRIIATSSPI